MSDSSIHLENLICLHVKGRISSEDAHRQQKTAAEILRRLNHQPGIILADEVGMGKTFVALAVAVTTHLLDRENRPVIVMVPPSIKQKWASDFETFRAECVTDSDRRGRLSCKVAERAEDLLKMLDDPVGRRASIIFLTHGAMSRGLTDPWIKLAIIQRALHGRHHTDGIYKTLYRRAGDLLDFKRKISIPEDPESFWEKLLKNPPEKWLKIINKAQLFDEDLIDDPVPLQLINALNATPTEALFPLYENLRHDLPLRNSANTHERLKTARKILKESMSSLWSAATSKLKLSLPLLIMDEAHHLKNEKTRLAALFKTEESSEDANSVSSGQLAGVFDRMLFLTATPFQLGHHELISVLDRFKGINWASLRNHSKSQYEMDLAKLQNTLDIFQSSAITLETAWSRLKTSDMPDLGNTTWWTQDKDLLGTPALRDVADAYQDCRLKMKASETLLKPLLIRHNKPKAMNIKNTQVERRQLFEGSSIVDDNPSPGGLAISPDSLLPFLLAARANACSDTSRPVFSEGLASSYEAFLDTRKKNLEQNTSLDLDDFAEVPRSTENKELEFYVSQIESTISRTDGYTSYTHPKVDATIDKAFALWQAREKVLIFCHYIETGKVLRHRISQKLNEFILTNIESRLQCDRTRAEATLDAISRAIDKQREILDDLANEILASLPESKALKDHQADIVDIMRRMMRTYSFITRYIPIEDYAKDQRLTQAILKEAFDSKDTAGMTFREIFTEFLNFLAQRSDKTPGYLRALADIKISTTLGGDNDRSFEPDEDADESEKHLNPTVRLVNGRVRPEIRNRLMLAFNTPFLPEIMIASAVMSEGVDLHINCRYVIHHDLSWNPSSLEQRNGRVDRIGGKMEKCARPIHIYLPYIEATQDEKMFKVVMDRERWFKVLMGGEVQIDSALETEKQASRVPFPESAAEGLAFKLEC